MSHSPGPELDLLVAKAIGVTPTTHDWRYDGSYAFECADCGLRSMDQNDEPCIQPYSTDANAALKAADEFFRRGYGHWWQVRRIDDKWQFLAPRIGVDVDGQSLPHAICLAILKAKE